MGQPRVCAHRGGAGLAPENTLAACRRSLRAGVRWLEVDVRQTADGVPVLIHDEAVDRTTDGRGLVRQMTFGQLRTLDAGGWFGEKYRGERVPSLEELLELLLQDPGAGAYVEVKGTGPEAELLTGQVLEMVRRAGLVERVRLASFDAGPLRTAAQVLPEMVRVALEEPFDTGDPLELVRSRQAHVWGPHHRRAGQQALATAHRAQVGVYTWTVNDPQEAVRLWHRGLGQHPEDAVATDFPERILATLREAETGRV
ncbi:MAG: glycerophosphodiester phosphodiesterase family protein [Armatimonadota bacterium]|nr:glycerophosphodiester phosphodiesterase family protein [Armatimonadota bacterium]